MANEKLNFFKYVELAKSEYKNLTEKYPELCELSKRELDVFLLLLTDKTQGQIADELFVSYSSVHFHCKTYIKSWTSAVENNC